MTYYAINYKWSHLIHFLSPIILVGRKQLEQIPRKYNSYLKREKESRDINVIQLVIASTCLSRSFFYFSVVFEHKKQNTTL
jgi:hypothetical protein